MMQTADFLYCPALRMKAGELAGLRDLVTTVKGRVLPRLVVPPIAERDESQLEFFERGRGPDIGTQLASFWIDRPALIDTTYLLDERDTDNPVDWLPQMFARARQMRVRAIPMVLLADIDDIRATAFRQAIDSSAGLKFGICLPSADLVESHFTDRVSAALQRLDLDANECAVIVDFHDADLSDVNLVAPVISSALLQLQDFGTWKHIVFQGTHYPEKNPANHNETSEWPRNEWIAWKKAIEVDSSVGKHVLFGDYAADCARINFGAGGARAIRHYRYTTESSWLIVRGAEIGDDRAVMHDVCSRIVKMHHFAGPDFSVADAYIDRTSSRLDGPGNSTTWRQVNTNHHVTRVVFDLSVLRGAPIAVRIPVSKSEQLALLSPQ